MPDPSPDAGLKPIDRDTICLRCGYNLRGLYGDPVRCPECGSLNPRDDVRVREEEIAKQLRAMQTAPAICVGATLLFLFLACLSVLTWIGGGDFTPFGAVAMTMVGVWFWGYRQFRERCRQSPGWAGLLVRYHIAGVGSAALICSAVIIGFTVRDAGLRLGPSALLGAGVAVGIVVAAIMRGPCARMRSEMDAMHRPAAEGIVREQFRRAIFHGALSWKFREP